MSTETLRGWMPDGIGLDNLSKELVAKHDGRVHLRLAAPDRYPRNACAGGIGEWWTGKASEVNCPSCLEMVHA